MSTAPRVTPDIESFLYQSGFKDRPKRETLADALGKGDIGISTVASVAAYDTCLLISDFRTGMKDIIDKVKVHAPTALPDIATEGQLVAAIRLALEADRDDHAARYELAQRLLVSGEQADAIDELLLIVRRDKAWSDGAARLLLLKVFDALGSGHELTKKGRRRLSNFLNI